MNDAMKAEVKRAVATLADLCNEAQIEVEPVLWLSTAHIREATNTEFRCKVDAELEASLRDSGGQSFAFRGLIVYDLKYGWLLVMMSDTVDGDALEQAGYPDLAAIVQFAKSLGLRWVRLDRDSLVQHGLPTYDW